MLKRKFQFCFWWILWIWFLRADDTYFDFISYYHQSETFGVRDITDILQVSHHLCGLDQRSLRKFPFYGNVSKGGINSIVSGVITLLGASIFWEETLDTEKSSITMKLLLYPEMHNDVTFIGTHCFLRHHFDTVSMSTHISLDFDEKQLNLPCFLQQSFEPVYEVWKEVVVTCSGNIDRHFADRMRVSLLNVELVDPSLDLLGFFPLCPIPNSPLRSPLLPRVTENPREIPRMVACSQPLFNVDSMETKWPGIVRFWILHHLFITGLSHFTVYDLDGTANKYIRDLIELGLVQYYPRFKISQSLSDFTFKENHPYCCQTYAENHCIWSYRGIAQWVLLLHAPDLFIFEKSMGGYQLYNELMNIDAPYVGLAWEMYDELLSLPDDSSILRPSFTEQYQYRVEHRSYLSPTPIVSPHRFDVLFVHHPSYPWNLTIPSRFLEQTFAKHFVTLFSNDLFPYLKQKDEDQPIPMHQLKRVKDDSMMLLLPWMQKVEKFLIQWKLQQRKVGTE